MNPFAETYKTYDDAALVDLLNNSDNYQPLAVEAARIELDSRRLSTAQLDFVNQQIEEREEQRRLSVEKSLKPVKDFNHLAKKLVDQLDPHEEVTAHKAIRYICISVSVLFLIELSSQWSYFLFMLRTFSSDDLHYIIWVLPYLMLPFAVYLFWEKRKWGWILLNLWAVYKMVSVTCSYFIRNQLSSAVSSLGQLFILLSAGGIFLLLFLYLRKQEIKNIFSIDNEGVHLMQVYALLIIIAFLGTTIF